MNQIQTSNSMLDLMTEKMREMKKKKLKIKILTYVRFDSWEAKA